MNAPHPDLDLTISRVIKAPRPVVWDAWTDPRKFEQWWVPKPANCRVQDWDLRPGGAFRTEIGEPGGDFGPHMTGCFLAVDELERIVLTNSLVAGWRPAEEPFMTAVISLADHQQGTEYTAHVMHRNASDRKTHEELGFHDGWGTVIEQLAGFVERTATGSPDGASR